MYYIWRESTGHDVWTHAEARNYLQLSDIGLDTITAKPVPINLPPLIVDIYSHGEPADFFLAGLVCIVSSKLRKLLLEQKVNAEFRAVQVYQLGKRYRRRKFYMLNILDVVDCFDYKKSKFRRTPKGIHNITRVAIDDTRANGHHLFIVGPLPSKIPNSQAIRDIIRCASEDLVTRITESGVSGVSFTTLQDRQKYPPPPMN